MKKFTAASLGSGSSGTAIGGGYIFSGNRVDHLIGRVLTHIETLGLRESQEKAIKDLLKQEIWAPFNGLHNDLSYVDEQLETVIRNVQHQARSENNVLGGRPEYTLTVEVEVVESK